MSSIAIRGTEIDEWIPNTVSIWHKAWDDPLEMSFESACAKITCVVFPIILAIGCSECIAHACIRVWKICNPENKSFESVITVELPSHDFPENQPSASAFHALNAIASIGTIFDIYAKELENGEVDKLSKRQQAIVKNGLKMYSIALERDPTIEENADQEHIKLCAGATVKRCADFGPTREETDPAELLEELFSHEAEKRAAWIKNSDEEFFSVIVYNDRVIIFDSHINAMTLIYGEEDARAFLIEKLSDTSPFSYAIGSLGIIS